MKNSSTEPQTPGDMLRAAREAAHLTQQQAADRADLSISTWGNLEKNRISVTGVGRISYRSTPESWIQAAAAVRADPRLILKAAGFDPSEHEAKLAEVATEKPAVVIIGVREGASSKEVEEAVKHVLDELG